MHLGELAATIAERVLRARQLGPRLGLGGLADRVQSAEALRAEERVAGDAEGRDDGEVSEEPESSSQYRHGAHA